MNNRGDKGSPCLTPHWTGNISVVKPLFKTQLETLVQKVLTHCRKYGPKLNFPRTLTIGRNDLKSRRLSENVKPPVR